MSQNMFQTTDYDSLDEANFERESRRSVKIPDRVKKWLIILTLIVYGHATSISCSIRYGFLVDAFSSRDVPGKIYGIIEGSMFIGYALIFLVGGVEIALKRLNSRYLLGGITLSFSVTTLATGLVYLIDHNTTVIVVSIVIRIVQGALSYGSSLAAVDFINAQLSAEFDLVNGILNMGYFSGHGLAEVFGCILYDKFGYVAPYIFASTISILVTIVILNVIPKRKTYLASQDAVDTATMKLVNPSNKLTKLMIFPMIATMLINTNYGVLQVTLTPFLHDNFNKSISYGGGVLAFVSIGMALGSLTAGFLLQRKILNHYTIMAIGALCVCLGLLVTFSPESLPVLYKLSPIIAFPGVFLAGFGDPLITLSCLRALYDLQLQKSGLLTPRSATLITGMWLMCYAAFYYSGATVAGILTDYLSYSEIAEILAGFSLLAVVICVFLRVFVTKKIVDVDEEAMPLLNGH